MAVQRQWRAGLGELVAGAGVLVFAVLLVGLRNDHGIDWVSVVTAVAGAILLITGFYTTFRHGPTT